MKKLKRLLFICLVVVLLAGAFTMQVSANTDHNALQAVINKFEALDEKVYSPATYRLAKMEYDNARVLIDDQNAKSDEINDAINALNKRIAGLKVANGSESLWKSYEDYFEMGNIYSGSGNLDSNNIRGMLTSTHFNRSEERRVGKECRYRRSRKHI